MPAIAALLLTVAPSRGRAQGIVVPRCGNGGDCMPTLCAPDAPCDRLRLGNAAVTRSSSRVSVTLSEGVLHYEVEETFVNHGGRIGEADYIFPLPHNAAFSELKLSINGELVGGETMDAGHARAVYEEIVRRQRDPALVEWMGYGMLRTRIFPILPGESKRVVVRFDEVAAREGDALRVDYTTGGPVGRRPIVRNISHAGDDGDSPESVFTLRYPVKANFGAPYSPTHELTLTSHDGINVVTARGEASVLTLLIPVARANGKPAITLLANADGRDDGFALINLVPPAASVDITPRDITFVIDVSGSMAGSKMEQARAAGRQLLSSLNSRDRFRLIDFSTDVRSFRDGFVPANSDNIRAALSYIGSLSAAGSTNISGALAAALRRDDDGERTDRLDVVLFLTDGQPTIGETRADAIAAEAGQLRGKARVFTFGLGGDVNVSLLEQLALQGRGTAQFVRPSEDVERAVALVSQRLVNPVATNVRVSADGVRLTRILPGSPIDVFAGQNIVILARYSGSGPATLRFDGDSPHGAAHWTQRVTFPTNERGNSFIGRLWATQRIGYLSAERRRVGGNPELDGEIRSLGEKFGIPTELTSYLVQEHAAPAPLTLSSAVSVGMTLNSIVATGATSGSLAAFEQARKATAQRAATTLAAADAATMSGSLAGGAADGATRRVGDRSFVLANGAWTDTRAAALQDTTVTKIHIQAFSAAYFRVLEVVPSIRAVLALGDHVLVVGRGIVLEVGPSGATDLDERDIAALRAGW